MATVNTFATRDVPTIRDAILRAERNGLIEQGNSDPNVAPGSDLYIEAEALANQLAVVEANCTIKADQNMPDTATGTDLERQCAPYGISRRPAAGSVGNVLLTSSAATTVTLGAELIDGAGLSFKVTTGGTYNDGDAIPVQAQLAVGATSGKATNHASGDALRWVTTPTFAAETVAVDTNGLVNGIDADDDEVLRARLFAVLQEPPVSGNASHVAVIAEESTAAVQKSFIHPAIEGPSTCHVAAVAAPTDTSKSRQVASATMTGTVAPYITGAMPESGWLVITTVADVNADVAFGLVLPEAPTASPPGPGGGWVNGTPWPAPDASTTWRCTVTAVTSTTQFTVDATTAPTASVSQICWLSPTDWKLYSATVTAVSGTSGAYVITLDQPFPNIATGCYIWPKCQNAQAYVDAVLAAFAVMGPGEKTSNPSALVRGFRHPRSAQGWPMSLGGHLTRAITVAQTEVESAEFFHRTDGTTTTTGPSGVVNPQLPAAVENAPNIYIPRHLGFYRVP